MISAESSMCKTKNRSYFLDRKMYMDIPRISDMMMIDCHSQQLRVLGNGVEPYNSSAVEVLLKPTSRIVSLGNLPGVDRKLAE